MAHGLVDVRILQREYLLAISRAVTAELDVQDVLRIILRAGVELVAGKAGMIALHHPELDSVRVAAVYGIPAALVDHFAPEGYSPAGCHPTGRRIDAPSTNDCPAVEPGLYTNGPLAHGQQGRDDWPDLRLPIGHALSSAGRCCLLAG